MRESTLAALAVLLSACEPAREDRADAEPAPRPAPAAATTASPPHPRTSRPPAFARAEGVFLGRDVERLLHTLRDAEFRSARELGGISLTFRVVLAGGVRCAFKPEVQRQRQKWQGEVAAYRIARLLDLEQDVPPAASRRVRREELFEALEHDERSDAARERLMNDVAWDDQAKVLGSVTYWIPDVSPRPLEKASEIAVWGRWLRPGVEIPPANIPLATQLSNLLVFDYLIGNWDRFSGAGFLAERDGNRIFFTDHNAAFYRPLPREAATKLDAHFELVERFSRRLVGRLRTLDEQAIRLEVGRDRGAVEILTDEQIADVLVRKDAVLRKVDRLVAQEGEDEVLRFE